MQSIPFPWIPFACAALHLTEELAWPGGFIGWYRWYRSDYARAITRGFIVGVNALLVALTIAIGILGDSPRGAALWLAVAALLGINGIWHLQATVRGGRYSPGVVTGTLLYLPMAVGGFVYFLRTGRATIGTAVASALSGGAYWVWSEWRKRRVEAARKN